MTRIDPKALGLALGILSGVGLAVWNILAAVWGYAAAPLEFFVEIYPGYSVSLVSGSLLALIYGFIDAFIGGYAVAWLYNKFNK